MSKRKETRREPVQARGHRSRSRLLESARRSFTRLGYVDTRVADIVKEAGVAHGTFYTYFDSKQEIAAALAVAVLDELDDAFLGQGVEPTCVDDLLAANRRYAELVASNAAIITTIEQASAFDHDILSAIVQSRIRRIAFVDSALGRVGAECNKNTCFALACGMVGALDGMLRIWHLENVTIQTDAAWKTLDDIFRNGFATACATNELPTH